MFSGIVEETAKVVKVERELDNMHFTLSCSFANELKIDQSVAHNGVCLTVVKLEEGTYTVTAMKETLNRSNLGLLKEGYLVNSRGVCNELPPIYWICQNRYDNGTVFNERSCDDTFIWYIIAEEDYSTIERFIGNTIDGKEVWVSVLYEGEQ